VFDSREHALDAEVGLSVAARAARIVENMVTGRIPADTAATVLQSLMIQARIIESTN
jgi:hypothetical protein